MSVIEALKNEYYRDVEKQKDLVIKHPFGFEMRYSPQRECFIGVAEYCKNCSVAKGLHGKKCKTTNKKFENKLSYEKGRVMEIMQEISTMVPIYWFACPNVIETEKDGKRKCGEHELVGIWEDGDTNKCRRCKHESKIIINIPDNAPQKKLLERIRNEK